MIGRGFVLGMSLLLSCPAAAGEAEFVTLKGHGGPIMALAVDPEGRIASASFDNTVALWEAGSPVWLDAHDAAVTAVAFGADGGLYSAGDDFAIYRWQAGEAELIGRHEGKVRALALSSGERWLASASWDGRIGLWHLATGEAHLIEVGVGVNDVRFGPRGEIYAATMAGEVQVRDAPDAPARILAQQGFGINRLLLSQDGWLAYGAVDGSTRVIDAETGAQIADFSLDRRPILALAHHPQTGQIAVGDGHGYIMMINTRDWSIARDFRAMREGPVWALAFSSDGARLWVGGLQDVVYGWPIALMDQIDGAAGAPRSFLRDPESMSNGERQFMRKCSICHDLRDSGGRKAGPHLEALFGRRAGGLESYRYSDTLRGSRIIWSPQILDALFDLGPDHYIPGSKMPMQRIATPQDRQDLIEFLNVATNNQGDN